MFAFSGSSDARDIFFPVAVLFSTPQR